jgi:hypothetical protein
MTKQTWADEILINTLSADLCKTMIAAMKHDGFEPIDIIEAVMVAFYGLVEDDDLFRIAGQRLAICFKQTNKRRVDQ